MAPKESPLIAEGAYWIRNLKTGKILTVGGTDSSELVHLDSQEKYPAHRMLKEYSQVWLVELLPDGRKCRIRNAVSGSVLDVKGGDGSDCTSIIVYDQTGRDNQHWTLEWVRDNTADAINIGKIKLESPPAPLAAELQCKREAFRLLADSTRQDAKSQVWRFEPYPFPPFFWTTISNYQTGKFLVQHDNAAAKSVVTTKGPICDLRNQWLIDVLAGENKTDPVYALISKISGNVLNHWGGK
ncbi:hypothetical protein VTN00DRAFT_8456 [Thermoascus crustaceus]|uniref:uncharacterized protein n=1 Tax=Thermoascus crustaceus TaxID=5088 RepID=UPI003741ED29